MRGLSAEDLTEGARVVSAVKLQTWCAICDTEQGGVVLVEHKAHGFLYVCPECRRAACVRTDEEINERYQEHEAERNKEAREADRAGWAAEAEATNNSKGG